MYLGEPVCGVAFGARSPVGDDAAFVVGLRAEARVARFLHRIPEDVAVQRAWQVAAVARDDDLPLTIFRRADAAVEGTVGIYRIDRTRNTAEWGRWALRDGSLAVAESLMLVGVVGFDVLGLDSMYCRTLVANRHVVALHDRMGSARESEGTLDVDGRDEPYVQHRLTATAWPAVRSRFEQLAAAVARRLP